MSWIETSISIMGLLFVLALLLLLIVWIKCLISDRKSGKIWEEKRIEMLSACALIERWCSPEFPDAVSCAEYIRNIVSDGHYSCGIEEFRASLRRAKNKDSIQ